MRRTLVLSLALLAIVRSPVVAQTCQGLASYSAGQLQVAGNAEFPEARSVWGASISYGMPSGVYAGADLSTTSWDNDLGSSLGIGAHAGYQMKLGRTGNMKLCPVARLALGMGPDDDANDINRGTTEVHFGVAVGTEMRSTPQLRIVPTAGLGVQYSKLKEEVGSFENDFSETYGLLRLGAGFVFNQQISVRPTIDIPVGSDAFDDPIFGLRVGYNFGKAVSTRARR